MEKQFQDRQDVIRRPQKYSKERFESSSPNRDLKNVLGSSGPKITVRKSPGRNKTRSPVRPIEAPINATISALQLNVEGCLAELNNKLTSIANKVQAT